MFSFIKQRKALSLAVVVLAVLWYQYGENVQNFVTSVFNTEKPADKVEVLAPFYDPKNHGNYEPTPITTVKYGPGEGGRPIDVEILNKKLVDQSVAFFGYNLIASDIISLDREIKDFRLKECKHWNYPTKLPNASVIIVFFNEGFSTLIRTIHSVINKTPPELLHEIILVDDFSKLEETKGRLSEYIKRFNGMVKLFRNTKHEGLIQARVNGITKAIGEVIVILDAHCECEANWLPPLLTRIKLNRKALAIPMIDGINWNNFEHVDTFGQVQRAGIFEWGFLYKEMPASSYPNYTRKYQSEPYWSPTHAGGLLAIERNWFNELGLYDTGIKYWGGEQYELSFKIWQCGGLIEWVPCSRVAHVYKGPRKEKTDDIKKSIKQSATNHLRVIEVWMDEYKELFYIRDPTTRTLNYGDVSKQRELREKLKCKSFKWYLENIAFDMPKKFPIPSKNKVWGKVINKQNNVCIDAGYTGLGGHITVAKCHNELGTQVFRLNEEGELSQVEDCFESDGEFILKTRCLVNEIIWDPVGEWDYDAKTGRITTNRQKNKCLATNGRDLWLADCFENNLLQKWEWKEVYY